MKLRKNYVIMKVGFLSKHHLQDKVFDSSFPKANKLLSVIAAVAVMMENDDFINFTLIILHFYFVVFMKHQQKGKSAIIHLMQKF